ncbi:glycerophosphodiester phosphodiesterase [Thermoflavimicrobium daqui]|uniref:Glycerophosphodiester phosphodiesterase n=1 Tax=Thermoflavimicrobium daqui TaxID=2137476 RepID=A0A364K0V8_9BACL|nr:glycerophosphodiester phosphodiesterase [Thermoflavimicrobium daqui]RAL21060.1 glycerophosphodiester phosphodiesterase [Thermoflavimicrobium daqui]
MKRWLKRTLGFITALGIGLTLSFSPTSVSAMGKNQLLSPDRVINVAHRGASGHAPEHTLLAYDMGKKMKADYIELDLQMTKDGHLIAMHDETLDRTTNGLGRVKDHTLAEIKRLDAGSWFNKKYPEKANPAYVGLKVPTLEEILSHFGRSANYYIETKAPEVYPGMEEKLIRSLKKHKLLGKGSKRGQVIIQSFSPDSLKKVHQLDTQVPLVQLGNFPMDKKTIAELKTYAIGVGPNYKNIDQTYVQKVRQAGFLLHPYTVNEKEEMHRLIKWGVTGMFTNFPDRLYEVLKKK